jgi:membrane-associated protease RseP (regulator of RpoE activity)
MFSPYPARLVSRFHRSAARFLGFTIVVLGIGTPAVQAMPLPNRWDELRAQDLRVATVSYRLSIANRVLCRSELVPQPGFVLQGIEQFASADRAAAARNYGLGSHKGVLAVVPGSPADRAGLSADDQLVSVNGQPLEDGPATASPTRAFVEQAQAVIVAAMREGAVTLGVSRASGRANISFKAESGCPSAVELVPGEDVNAWADGSRVVVSSAILAHCRTDDDLALVIAHEMAHNLLHHPARLAAAHGSTSGRLGLIGSGSAEMRETEEEADDLAVKLAKAAAYDLRGAESFMGDLLRGDGAARAASTHPATARRLTLLRAAIGGLISGAPRAARDTISSGHI